MAEWLNAFKAAQHIAKEHYADAQLVLLEDSGQGRRHN